MAHIRSGNKVILAGALLGAVLITSAFQVFELQNAASAVPATQFVNFESAHVHPLDRTPDGTKLLAVNTANNTLEVFQLGGAVLLNIASIPVGLDPVSVRARTNNEVWVVNTISDEVSIVDLALKAVIRSLPTENEPSDVVFAGSPQRAFVSCAERESIQVFDIANLGTAPTEVLLKGEQPRAMAVSPDGNTVYTAFFESGNQTTVVAGNTHLAGGICSPQGGCTVIPNDVTRPAGPYGGVVPVPNAGTGFQPPLNTALPPMTATQSIIVRKNNSGQWMDDNNHNWTNIVSGGAGTRVSGWDLPDRDVAILNANNLALSYQAHLGNILMAMAVNPATGKVTVVGTDATNEVRYEPNLNGRFLRVNMARFDAAGGGQVINDLNTHINYANTSLPLEQRTTSIGDPRGIAWRTDGSKGYITGMGSNNVITVNATGARVGPAPIAVGEGPTGIVLDETRNKAYVLNKFEGTISTIDMTTDKEIGRANFFDPTPLVIKAGRKFLYDTHLGSGNGHIACGSCHVDGRWDRLGWDLGDPSGSMLAMFVDRPAPQADTTVMFHPMKGVKTTQFLIDIMNKATGKLHWRGDKTGFADFAGAFSSLQGADASMSPEGMTEFANFLGTTYHPPNPYRPYRPLTDSPVSRCNPNRIRGTGTSFQTIPNAGVPFDAAINQNCTHCHQAQTGRGALVSVAGNQNMSPDLRSVYKKNGFFYTSTESTAGFGLMSDGVMATVFNESGVSDYLGDYEAELMGWSGGIVQGNSPQSFNFPLVHTAQDVNPTIGMRMTINGSIGSTTQLNTMKAYAQDFADVGMIVKGIYGGEQRGFYFLGGDNYQSDIAGQTVTHSQLVTSAQGGSPLSWTLVHPSTEVRAGVDADADGVFDHDDLYARVNVRANLEGPFDGTAMRSDLRTLNLLPATDPYGLGATASPAVMARTGMATPVDWAVVELRNSASPTQLVASRAVLVLRSGDLVMPGGEQTVTFPLVASGTYHVVVRHRNHLGVMTAQPVLLREPGTLIDFTAPATATWGTAARKVAGASMVLWMGDVNGDGVLRYTGAANDRDPVLVRIGGLVPTNTVAGYFVEDVDLSGTVKYTGAANDRDPILVNIGGTVPTNVRSGQLP